MRGERMQRQGRWVGTGDAGRRPGPARAGAGAGRRCWVLLAVLVLGGLLGVARPMTVRAHAFLVQTAPQAGERLAARPAAVTLQFSEPVVAGSEEITVRRAGGPPVSTGRVERLGSGTQLRASLPPVDEGIYVVNWRVLAVDGHLAAGEFAFAIGAGGRLPTATSAAAAIAWPESVASALFLGGLVLAIGGLASEAAVWGPVGRRRGRTVPLAPVAASLLLALLGAALQFALLARAQAGAEAAFGLDPGAWRAAFATRPGLLTAAALAGVAYGLWILRVRRLRAWALVPLAGAVVATAFRGHSGTAGDWWAAPANALHLVLASLWVGALVHLVLVLWRLRDAGLRPLLGEAAQRYAGLALLLVPPLLAAGVATALAEVSQPADLVATTYGQLLVLKLLFVGAALALALAARLRALPATPGRLDRLRRLTGAEGAALVAVLAVSAVLVNAVPPRGVAAEADLLGPAPLTGPVVRVADLAGQHATFLAAAEGQLQLRVLAPTGEPDHQARVQVTGRSPGGAGLDLYPRSCGAGCFTIDFPWSAGTTHLRATVVGGAWTGGLAEFAVPWPPGPEQAELLDRVIATMRVQPTIILTEQVSSGPGATTAPNTFSLTGPQFIAQEAYAAGGASDIRLLPGEPGLTELSLYIPGSAMWYRLAIDTDYRLRRELIINPGHRIERRFDYRVTTTTP